MTGDNIFTMLIVGLWLFVPLSFMIGLFYQVFSDDITVVQNLSDSDSHPGITMYEEDENHNVVSIIESGQNVDNVDNVENDGNDKKAA